MTLRIVSRSVGSFLCPPGHPNHRLGLEDGPHRNPHLIASLHYALDEGNTDVPESMRERVREIMRSAELVCSEQWVRHVYGYFRNCYSPDGATRNVNQFVSTGPAEHHLGYLTVREYFPDHEPRVDLIENGGDYGSRECAKCGTRVQYEARVDAFAEPLTAKRECPKGGTHE